MVRPEMGMSMEMVFDGSNGMPSAGDYADLQPEELGRETIGGEAVTKYRIEAGEGGESYTVLIWATDDGIALRMEGATAEGGFEMQLSDLERGPQPAALFEVPAGMQIMAVPGQSPHDRGRRHPRHRRRHGRHHGAAGRGGGDPGAR